MMSTFFEIGDYYRRVVSVGYQTENNHALESRNQAESDCYTNGATQDRPKHTIGDLLWSSGNSDMLQVNVLRIRVGAAKTLLGT